MTDEEEREICIVVEDLRRERTIESKSHIYLEPLKKMISKEMITINIIEK